MDYSNLILFCKRWQEKANSENPDGELNECFDHFFTSFVIYNCIYNFCYYLKHDKEYGDRGRAIELIANFVEGNGIISFVLEQIGTDISNALNALNSLYVYDRTGAGVQSETDLKQELSLQNIPENRKDKLKGVLKLLYKVRCNMFHGDKVYIPKQLELIRPLNHILDILNATLIEVLRKKHEEEIAKKYHS